MSSMFSFLLSMRNVCCVSKEMRMKGEIETEQRKKSLEMAAESLGSIQASEVSAYRVCCLGANYWPFVSATVLGSRSRSDSI
jgi:hypothetical protein